MNIALFLSAIIFQSASELISTFARNIRIVDILDVAIISIFLYIVLNWLRQSASRQSLLSFFILITIYAIARFTGMYLTELLIEALFIIILIGIVVVFQSDLRRMIDRLGNWSWFEKSAKPTSDIATSIITEAAAKMAENKTGALIVIKGKESWDRHIHGGIELNGRVTIPLLHSIFNKYAPGHDGAVLMEGNYITKFGVHLPLSTNLHKMTRGGTRHTAALGICEHCDALVVVVSEERGIISIAQDGEIHELESSSDLKKHLDTFWAEHYQNTSTSFTQWWKKRSLRTAIAAVALSIVLFMAFAYQSGTAYRTYEVPIEYRNLKSSNIMLQDSVPVQARVTLSGPEQAFRTFDKNQLVISFDLATEDLSNGELEITNDDINLPADLQFFEASPPTLKLQTRNLNRIKIPVKIPKSGKLRSSLELISITASPTAVDILADTSLSRQDSISTDTVDLSTIQTSTTIQKRLQLGDGMQLPDQSSHQVYVEIKVRKNSE